MTRLEKESKTGVWPSWLHLFWLIGVKSPSGRHPFFVENRSNPWQSSDVNARHWKGIGIMDFFAIDFETANANRDSICQVGLAKVVDSKVIEVTTQMIDPKTYFDPINISIHGIDENTVAGQPSFSDFAPSLIAEVSESILISHTAFDRIAMDRACATFNIEPPRVIWLDSARIVRRAWPDHFALRGYGLKNVAKILGIEFNHHDAGEDARAAAEATIIAVTETGINLGGWIKKVNLPIFSVGAPEDQETNQDGPFWGATLVFTGALNIPRREAAKIAAQLGFTVGKSVTAKTDYLVVGDQDVAKLAGKKKSSKHIKAETLIKKGQELRILAESDFAALTAVAT